jgi:ectoine hydroxylase-related dioxygenase (phytanoyl-CoA dioxygenase family)
MAASRPGRLTSRRPEVQLQSAAVRRVKGPYQSASWSLVARSASTMKAMRRLKAWVRLSHPGNRKKATSMLTNDQIQRYDRDGFIVVENILSPDEIAELRAVTDDYVDNARHVTENDAVYDLEPGHSAERPRVRRIKAPHRQHDAYARTVTHPRILAVLKQLIGPAIHFDMSKLNLKEPGGGAAVEWHQDWAFYPATNDDLCAVGVMLDDCAMQNGPLLIIPGSHRGPVYDHHANGRFCGAIDAGTPGIDWAAAQPAIGPAGSISIHHVRAVHGSAPNVSDHPRRLFLLQYRAADAWPLLPEESVPAGMDFEEWERSVTVAGWGTFDPIVPRVTAVPVRLPFPPAENTGSIYENQRALKNSFFADPESGAA